MSDRLFFGPSKKYMDNYDDVFGKKVSRAEALEIADENYKRVEKSLADEVERDARGTAVWEELFEHKEQTEDEKLKILEKIYLEKVRNRKKYYGLRKILNSWHKAIKKKVGKWKTK